MIGYTFQSWLMTVILGLSSYFLIFKPNYFGTVTVGIGAVLVSPVGGYLLKPHADEVIDYLANATSTAMTDLLSSTISELTGRETNVLNARTFVINVSQSAIDTSIDHLEMNQDAWVNLTKNFLVDATDALTMLEDITTPWINFTAKAIQDIFGWDVLELFKDKSIEAVSDPEVGAETAANLVVTALDVFENTSVRESLVSGTRNAVLGLVDDVSFIGEVVDQITEASAMFRTVLSVAGASTGLDPMKVEEVLQDGGVAQDEL